MKALIVIDYTRDFVDGALPVGQPAIDIEQRIVELTEKFVSTHDYVVMAVDMHEPNDAYHPETTLFPPHNIRGTAGRELYGRLSEVYAEHQQQIVWMDKTRYSAFAGTDLELKLRERGITELHLIGVCTDICVLHTAVDAYNKGFKLVIHTDAIASFNAQGHVWAIDHFEKSIGAQLIYSY